MTHKLFDRFARRWAWVATALRVQDRFSELHGSYLASAITLAAFLSLFPLLLISLAILGFLAQGNSHLAADVINQLGLSGDAAKTVVNAINTAQEHRRTSSLIGIVGLLWTGLGLVATLEFALNAIWQVIGRGLKDKLFGLLWLAGASLIVGVSFGITAAIRLLPGFFAPVSIVIGLAIDILLWWWTLKVLPNRNVGWQALLPGAIFGGIGLEALKYLGTFYIPHAIASSSALYGSIGTVFAILAWLLFFGRLVVYSSVLNVVRWEEDHGTVTVEMEIPNLPNEAPVTATRAGEMQTVDDAN